jgi:hypothetical protein
LVFPPAQNFEKKGMLRDGLGNRVAGARATQNREQVFDPENSRVIFPPKEAKGKKYHRIIYLSIRANPCLG